MRIGLFASDPGPLQVISALAKNKETVVCGSLNSTSQTFDAIVVGTSDSLRGKNHEHEVRIAAKAIGLPLICIEDYPGNYQNVKKGEADLLIVESDLSKKIYYSRFSDICPATIVIPNPRYDQLRQCKTDSDTALLGLKFKNSILWAGQPDTDDNIKTLNRITPVLKEVNLKLLFKAHPNDMGYFNKSYDEISQNLEDIWEDVSPYDLLQCVEKYAPRLILTQFSSLAIEGGFYSIPSMNILFSDIGASRFLQKKGYSMPLSVNAGATMAVQNIDVFKEKITEMIFDDSVREKINNNFYDFYGKEPTASKVIDKIKDFIKTRKLI